MRWVVRQHQVLQDQDHEPVGESPLQLNMGVRWRPAFTFRPPPAGASSHGVGMAILHR